MRKSVVAAMAASAALAGCHARSEDGGATVSRNYQVGNFQQIEIAGPYEVNVRTGSGPTVSAQGGERLLDRTSVAVEGDKLVIKPEHGGSMFHFGWSTHGKATFTVTVPALSGATIAGSGGINIDKVGGQNFAGTVTGSGELDVGAMDVQSLKLSIGGSGDIKAGAGQAQSGEYQIGGSGDIDASGIQTQAIKASIGGSGSIKARSTGSADINIMGSGDIAVTGGAKCNVNKMGSGSATCS
jgi:Putative auto-transporter adhesin, head GIN domain